jgi:glycosyltransferase involved in cell wall biosynthesis
VGEQAFYLGATELRATNGVAAPRRANGALASAPQRYRVSFVLPAFNEEANILKAIDETVSVASRCCAAYEVVVVDDGSTDETARLVAGRADQQPEIRLVRHRSNRGYGEALRTGFSHASLDFVFFTDSDNQFDLGELPLLLAWADRADLVAGYRKRRRDPLVRRLNAWAWNRLIRVLFYIPVRDVDCAFKLFRRSALTDITIESRGALINTEIVVKLARRGAHIVEVGVTHLPRTAGEPSGADPRVILRAFREIARMYNVLDGVGKTSPELLPSLVTVPQREALAPVAADS